MYGPITATQSSWVDFPQRMWSANSTPMASGTPTGGLFVRPTNASPLDG